MFILRRNFFPSNVAVSNTLSTFRPLSIRSGGGQIVPVGKLSGNSATRTLSPARTLNAFDWDPFTEMDRLIRNSMHDIPQFGETTVPGP